MSDQVLIERRGAVQVVRMNRADKKNAITRPMYKTMAEALRAGDADDAVHVFVFLGVPGAFSAGNDLQDFLAFAQGGELGREVIDFLMALATVRKPVLAGVDGLAIGIGTTLVLHCDLAFATPRSMFRTPFVELALVPEAGSSLLAPKAMGHQRAFALLAAGLPFSAEEAREAGLVYQVAAEEVLEQKVLEAAEHLAARPPQALQLTRELMKGATREMVVAQIEREAAAFAERLRSPEARQAFEKFLARKG